MTYRNMFSYKEIFRFVAISLCIVFGALNSGLLPAQAQTNTWYVDGTNGNDNNNGSAQTPWKTVQKAINTITPGSTVIIRAGLYRINEIQFGPAGTGVTSRTIFKSAPNERVIFSRSDDFPPQIGMANFVRIEGLWFGGKWDKQRQGGLFQVGGGPISDGKQIINCTIFGYVTGIEVGSSQNLLIQGNRMVHNGNGTLDHGIYMSGGYTAGSMTQHVIIDGNILVDGEGYGIHGWHNPHSAIITRNFVGQHTYGLVIGDTSAAQHLVANNIIWKLKDSFPGVWLPGNYIYYANNVHAPGTYINSSGGANSVITHNVFFGSTGGPKGTGALQLASSLIPNVLGQSEATIDQSIALLDQIFNQTVANLYSNQTVEQQFQILRSLTTPNNSTYAQQGVAWFDGVSAVGFGIIPNAPTSEAGLWRAFNKNGLLHYDRFGVQGTFQIPPDDNSTSVSPTTIPTNIASRTPVITPTNIISNTPTKTVTPSPITLTPTKTSTLQPISATPTKTSTLQPASATPSNTGCPCSLWATPIPTTPAQPDNAAVEVGVRFQSNINGYITGIRFYKGNTNTGTHVGHLWSANGTLLAQATFTSETASGWQVVTFASPIAITANTVYVASYYAPRGNYAVNRNYFTAAYSRGPLTALATTNGVYGYGALGTFPRGTYQATNYWVDVIFSNTLQSGAPVAYVTTNTPIPPSSTLAEPTFTSTPLPTLSPTAVVSDVPALVVDVSNASTTSNNTVAVNLDLKNVNNVYGLEVTCQIDPTVLIGKSHSDTTGFNQSNSFIIDTGFNSADGTWHLAASRLRPNPAIIGNDVAFSLNYEVLSTGSTSINCSAIAADINGMELALQVINGSYGSPVPPISPTNTVVPPTETLIPTLLPVTETLVPTDEIATSVPVSKSTISGIVNYPATTNHAGITVTLLAADSSVLSQIVTIVDGAYSFKDIPIGAYTVQYTASRSLTIRRIVLVETDGKSIDLGVTILLMGDTDGNNTIDLNDAALIGANFGINVPPAPNQVDLNSDGLINIVDLTLMGVNYNMVGPIALN